MPYESHKELKQPSLTQQLWRFMDFSKFTALLQNNGLYFPSLSQLAESDPWEGLHSKESYMMDPPVINTTKTLSELLGKERFLELQKGTVNSAFRMRKTFYANSWHINDSESDSQWRIYGSNDLSLAIISNLKKINAAISDPKTIVGGEVIYYHPDRELTSMGNIFRQVIYKRQAFSHEREFRLIYWDTANIGTANEASGGITVAINLSELIERVVVSPRAPPWFVNVVVSLIKDYRYNFQCSKSNLLEKFVF